MKSTISITILLLLSTLLTAQQYFQWTTQLGGSKTDYVNSIVCPDNNKIYATGGFVENISSGDKEAEGSGMRDIFFACFDSEGNTEWVKSLGGQSVDNATRLGIGEKCIYMAGTINGEVNVGKQKFSGEEKAFFVASWSLKGKINWLKRFSYSGMLTSDVLQVSPDGKIITGGMFQGTLTIDDKNISSKGKVRAFVLTLSADGKLLNFEVSEGEGEHRFVSATFNKQNECYYLFSTTGHFNFGKQTSIYQDIKFNSGLIVQKSGKDNSPEWAQFIEDSGYSEGVQLVSQDDELFLCVNFREQLKCKDTRLETSASQAVALLKFDKQGKINWSEVIQGPSRCRAMDVICNKTGNLLVTGYYNEGYKVQDLEIRAPNHDGNIFLIQFDKKGKVAWHNEPGDNAPNFSKSFTLSQTGDILLAGGFRGTLELEGHTLESEGSTDVFLAKYYNCSQLETNIADPGPVCLGGKVDLSASGQFTSFLWNGEEWGATYTISEAGTYFVSAFDERGCAAIDTIEILQADPPDLGLPEEETISKGKELTLEANSGFTSYLWSDGETGYKRTIDYQTETDSITLELNAETFDGCIAQDSVLIYFMGEETTVDHFSSKTLKVYPNPVEEYLWWELGLAEPEDITVTLSDGNSKIVYINTIDRYIPNTSQQINMQNLAVGNYLLTISIGNINFIEKVIKR